MHQDDEADVHRAQLAARRIELAARIGAASAEPEQHHARVLVARHSSLVRYLVRCQTAGVVLIPTGVLGLVLGVLGFSGRTWSVVAMLVGGGALAALSVTQFLAVQRALHIPAGLFAVEASSPPDA